jgi:hypothetical protein
MEIFAKIASTDSTIPVRVNELDKRALENGRYETVSHDEFTLAAFIQENLVNGGMEYFEYNVLIILWMACCADHSEYEKILKRSKQYLEADGRFNQERLLSMSQFIQELAETLATEIPIDERRVELKHFEELILFEEEEKAHPGEKIIAAERQKIYTVHYLRPEDACVALLLQPQINFDELKKHTIIKKLCRGLDKSEPMCLESWREMIDWFYDRVSSGSVSFAKSSVLDGFVKYFSEDLAALNNQRQAERFVQLMTVYRSDWYKIWTTSDWRTNRSTVNAVVLFQRDFEKPFYKEEYITQIYECIRFQKK